MTSVVIGIRVTIVGAYSLYRQERKIRGVTSICENATCFYIPVVRVRARVRVTCHNHQPEHTHSPRKPGRRLPSSPDEHWHTSGPNHGALKGVCTQNSFVKPPARQSAKEGVVKNPSLLGRSWMNAHSATTMINGKTQNLITIFQYSLATVLLHVVLLLELRHRHDWHSLLPRLLRLPRVLV